MSTNKQATVNHFDLLAELELRYPLPTDADREKVVAYFDQFADTRTDDGEVLCPGCGATLYGDRGAMWQAFGLYSFEWGIAHGEGLCGHEGCGWPARGNPEVMLSDGRVVRFPLPLPYHPDRVGTATVDPSSSSGHTTEDS